MLSGVLLHMLAAAFGIDATANANADGRQLGWRLDVMQYSAVLCVRYFCNSQTLRTFEREPPGVVHLTAAGGIERRLAQDNGWPWLLRRRRYDGFNHGIEFVGLGIVVVKAFGHSESALM